MEKEVKIIGENESQPVLYFLHYMESKIKHRLGCFVCEKEIFTLISFNTKQMMGNIYSLNLLGIFPGQLRDEYEKY